MEKRLGYQHRPNDVQAAVDLAHLPTLAQKVCEVMADDPFVTQNEIVSRLKIDLDTARALSATLRQDAKAQHFILNHGNGSKYWLNTILPLLSNGSLRAAIDGTYMYPNRIGIYTGMSCMFYCNFCGRNPTAKYAKDWERSSLDTFKQIVDQDPKQDLFWKDRFRISGGLEPLTNRYLGDIITYGHSRGFEMQLYTNGFMLTPNYLRHHPGLMDLYALRISLYGVSKEGAFRVTRHEESFDRIIDNIIHYLDNNHHTKMGMNWIVLPGHAQDVRKLITLVDLINQRAKRPLDFITLREDFSQDIRVLSDSERNELIEIFQDIDEFQKSKWPTTHWDFGYALDPLRHGRQMGGLEMVSWKQMVPTAFPQVAVSVDVKGDVYLYHESGFLERPGSQRYIIGNTNHATMKHIVKNFIDSKQTIKPLPSDVGFLDAFDHVVTKLINQARQDAEFGIPWCEGPVCLR